MNKKRSQAVTIRPANLGKAQRIELSLATPPQFLKTRKAKGGKEVSYVEIGYVISRLNAGISPVGWQFEVVDYELFPSKENLQEVFVKGRLTLKDRNSDYEIVKEQFGSHQHHKGVFVGDTLKAAGSDALKKCASLLGIAGDIYWPGFDEGGAKPTTGNKVKKETSASVVKKTLDMIALESNKEVLKQWRDRCNDSDLPSKDKITIMSAINDKLGS